MKRLMQKLFLSCERATMLEEKRREEGLSFREGLQLRMHLGMCATCRSYKALSQKMDRLLYGRFRSGDQGECKMPEERKEALMKEMGRDRY